jgi:hypothetical protein
MERRGYFELKGEALDGSVWKSALEGDMDFS